MEVLQQQITKTKFHNDNSKDDLRVHLPLIRWSIVTAFAASMLKFQGNLELDILHLVIMKRSIDAATMQKKNDKCHTSTAPDPVLSFGFGGLIRRPT